MLKENINKIDYELKGLFDSVTIVEKNHKNNFYLEIICESKKTKVRVNIDKINLNGRNVKWSYYTNPLNENSDIIDRVSNIDSISNDIFQILSKKQMNSEYLESIKFDDNIVPINESSVTLEEKEELQKKIDDIVKRFQLENVKIEESYKSDFSHTKTAIYQGKLKTSEKFLLEGNFQSIGIQYVTFNEDMIKIIY